MEDADTKLDAASRCDAQDEATSMEGWGTLMTAAEEAAPDYLALLRALQACNSGTWQPATAMPAAGGALIPPSPRGAQAIDNYTKGQACANTIA